ncbi:diacylglycerol kinase family protein [Spongiactinospora sp. TRM90649]|uniref:diacylglycerol/lipid kinase family protein n=1 Tax=Spongiactinospora sp. TRM90649 TaxID=3031114 RepID=UPI0023F79A76|nr:diacylglycerol kinase family protein [Spongiactinospora sp. TRM90649]MDF5752095.1 diacylglycerol kinase family protein [Spongiactinospora sp. TRM90649]
MRRLLVIANAAAGGADDDAVERARAVLAAGADVAEATAADPARLPALLGEHPGRDPVVMGGDGTLHALVAALDATGGLGSRTVGLIPMGTGNDFARALGLPLDPGEAARVIARGERRRVDLIRDDRGGLVVNALHLGVGVEAVEAAAPLKPVLHRLAYAAGALRAGLSTTGSRIRVTVDGRVVADGDRKVLMAGVGNGSTIGGGTPLVPDARPDDGQADVVVSFATGPLQRLAYGVLLRLGRHVRHETVRTARGADIRITCPPLRVNADGELIGPVSGLSLTVEPGAWSVYSPARRDFHERTLAKP